VSQGKIPRKEERAVGEDWNLMSEKEVKRAVSQI